MKLKTNDVLAILERNVNKSLKKFESITRYGWLRVIDRKTQFCLILMKLKTNDVLAILEQINNKGLKKIENITRYGRLRVIYRKNPNPKNPKHEQIFQKNCTFC